jgi:hypothetical protein
MTDPVPIPPHDPEEDAVARIVAAGPTGTIAVTGIATIIVVAIWLAFYLLVFVPRGAAL